MGHTAARPRAPGLDQSPTITDVPKSCIDFDATPTVSSRNGCVFDLVADIDYNFTSFREKVQTSVDYTNFALDFASVGLGAAGTAVASNTAKTILSGINTGVSGTKTALNQDILYKNTVAVLLVQMEGDRDKQYAIILASTKNDLSSYTMSEARVDLLKYYAAGTWSHALGSLQSSTGASAAAATSAVNSARTFKFDNGSATIDLLAFLTPGGAYDKDAANALTSCVNSTTVPAVVTLENYKLPKGGYELGGLVSDSAVDAKYKSQLLTCAKAGLAKQLAAATQAAVPPPTDHAAQTTAPVAHP
jgi:hypothetical protein